MNRSDSRFRTCLVKPQPLQPVSSGLLSLLVCPLGLCFPRPVTNCPSTGFVQLEGSHSTPLPLFPTPSLSLSIALTPSLSPCSLPRSPLSFVSSSFSRVSGYKRHEIPGKRDLQHKGDLFGKLCIDRNNCRFCWGQWRRQKVRPFTAGPYSGPGRRQARLFRLRILVQENKAPQNPPAAC